MQSDYDYRGLSFSEGRPTLSLNLSYDHASGAYAGASAIGVDTARSGVEMLGYVAYAGYARRLTRSLSWDVGASNLNMTDFAAEKYTVNYTELYAGVSSQHLSAHLHYSPNYLGEGRSSLYANLDGAVGLGHGWRAFGHVGVLTPLNGAAYGGGREQRYDFRAGLAAQVKACELRLAWTNATPDIYTEAFRRERNAVIVSASYSF